MSLNALDFFVLLLLLSLNLYGFFRGLRSALTLLVTSLSAVLAILSLTLPLERLFLSFARITAEDYPGAPAVALFLLKEKPYAAYLASLIPFFLTLLIFLLSYFLSSYRKKPSPAPPKPPLLSRFIALPFSLLSSIVLILAATVQTARLPWSFAGKTLQNSHFIVYFSTPLETLFFKITGIL